MAVPAAEHVAAPTFIVGTAGTGLTVINAVPLTVSGQVDPSSFIEFSEYVTVVAGETLNVYGEVTLFTFVFVLPFVYWKSYVGPVPVKFTVNVADCPAQVVAPPLKVAVEGGELEMVT